MDAFPRVGRLSRGYDAAQVDDFFAAARQAYERLGGRPPGEGDDVPGGGVRSSGVPAARAGSALDLTSEEVRSTCFDLHRHGYDVVAVDAALARLEDAVARHERELSVARRGRDAYLEDLAARARTVTGRLRRRRGERAARASGLHRGYHVGEVDDLCDRLRGYFDDGDALAVDEVRGAVFRARRGRRAYAEAPVDALLARAVEVMVTAPD
ncbi:DivIVA domain-containing protein [Pseudokineococcus basanitobsidens]|uniref:DivIVA domain-containing protein n=1 Tax=Pseudokineococcus basanitobsidens TaxID=1926649 RepID=A0ABU8RJV8_9ACTN